MKKEQFRRSINHTVAVLVVFFGGFLIPAFFATLLVVIALIVTEGQLDANSVMFMSISQVVGLPVIWISLRFTSRFLMRRFNGYDVPTMAVLAAIYYAVGDLLSNAIGYGPNFQMGHFVILLIELPVYTYLFYFLTKKYFTAQPSVADEPLISGHLVQDRDKRYIGIRGWLMLYAINAVVTPFLIIITLGTYALVIIGQISKWPENFINTILIGYEIVFTVILFVLSAITLILLFKKKRSFVKMVKRYLTTAALYAVSDVLFSIAIGITIEPKGYAQMIRVLVAAFVWMTYFETSVRVKNTFVNP